MEITNIYRRRLIPSECILLKDDIIVTQDSESIITTWNTLNPKTEFNHGCSLYLLKEGIKISKMYRAAASCTGTATLWNTPGSRTDRR